MVRRACVNAPPTHGRHGGCSSRATATTLAEDATIHETHRAASRVALLAPLLALFLASGLGAQSPDVTVPQDPGPAFTPWGVAWYFTRATASDAWAVTRAPFHLRGSNLLLAGGVLAVGAVLFAYDEPIWEHVRDHADDPLYREVYDVADFVEPLALQGRMNKYYAAGTVVGYVVDGVWGDATTRHIFEELMISNIISTAGRRVIGKAVGRERPQVGEGPYAFHFGGGLSFPSGHVANLAALATVLSHHIDWWPASVGLYGVVGTMVVHRLVESHHWASDSWIGAFWGYGIAKVVISRREADHVRFTPVAFGPGDGVGFAVTIPTSF